MNAALFQPPRLKFALAGRVGAYRPIPEREPETMLALLRAAAAKEARAAQRDE
ncbi:MAG TPA: hypothetical protein VFY92_12815 [Hyphomicrobiaceae bacterium]|nr:hypothetical protein [Hyphomicrobiaceae bacterium]